MFLCMVDSRQATLAVAVVGILQGRMHTRYVRFLLRLLREDNLLHSFHHDAAAAHSKSSGWYAVNPAALGHCAVGSKLYS